MPLLPVLQACPVGEFAARLQLLRSFHCQLTAMAAQAQHAEHALRWRQLAAVLHNVYRYYGQFLPHVEKQIAGELKQLEKELQVGGGRVAGRHDLGGTIVLSHMLVMIGLQYILQILPKGLMPQHGCLAVLMP